MDITISVKGKLVQRLLKKFPRRMNKVIKDSLEKGAEVALNRAKQLVPVDRGHLRRSIHSDVRSKKAVIGTNVVYAKVREYNTKSKPKGYMRPAYDRVKRELPRIFNKNIKKALRP